MVGDATKMGEARIALALAMLPALVIELVSWLGLWCVIGHVGPTPAPVVKAKPKAPASSPLVDHVLAHGRNGVLLTSQRRLAQDLNMTAAQVNRLLAEGIASGAVRALASRRGTQIEIAH
jgi:hypothetical protein